MTAGRGFLRRALLSAVPTNTRWLYRLGGYDSTRTVRAHPVYDQDLHLFC